MKYRKTKPEGPAFEEKPALPQSVNVTRLSSMKYETSTYFYVFTCNLDDSIFKRHILIGGSGKVFEISSVIYSKGNILLLLHRTTRLPLIVLIAFLTRGVSQYFFKWVFKVSDWGIGSFVQKKKKAEYIPHRIYYPILGQNNDIGCRER